VRLTLNPVYQSACTKQLRCCLYSAPGANVIKLFMSVIYGFSYYARVYVRLDQKSLPMTNTQAYYVIYGQKSFITLGQLDFGIKIRLEQESLP
jgi:hypothetical protein